MTDSIYDDVCHMYPDIAEYARANGKKMTEAPETEAIETQIILDRDRNFGRFDRGFRRRRPFRRRGMLRDIIDILLLSEFFRRRRRMY